MSLLKKGSSFIDSGMDRRNFLKGSISAALGVAGALSLPGNLFSEELTVNGLPATIFGKTGLKVTKISFGGILITEPPVLMKVIDEGINFIHTAPGYQNGKSMEAFGKVMKTRRKDVVLALKERPENLDKALKVLNTDYVDILVPPLHSLEDINDETIPVEFEKAKKAGKCGFMGFADHAMPIETLNRAVELGWFDAALLSFGPSDKPEFVEATKRAQDAGMGIMAMKGLTGRPKGDLNEEQIRLFTTLCSEMLEKQHAHTVLASMASFQAVDAYKEMLSTKIGFRDTRLENMYRASLQGSSCSHCGTCVGVCPEGRDIQRIVRYRMYDKEYGMKDYARSRFNNLGRKIDDNFLAAASQCEKHCPRSLPLADYMNEAGRIFS